MKILIKQRHTSLFFKAPGAWTPYVQEAQNFSGALVAYQFSRQHSLGDTELVFQTVNRRPQRILQQR